MLKIRPIAAFTDNYIWLLHNQQYAVVVDPGDPDVVLAALAEHGLILSHILITHHHQDHIGGVARLLSQTDAKVYASAYEHYAFNHIPVTHGQSFYLPEIATTFEVMHLPGHTLGHIAYYSPGHLFCGDTLFSAGCGRLFEGTPAQMFASLHQLAQLPADTKVYCTHEYTEKNIQFALTVEPNNPALQTYQKQIAALRQQQQASLPSSIQQELAINPFLRCEQASIKQQLGMPDANPLKIFTELRARRNLF